MVIDQFELSFENNPDGLDGISFALIPYFALIIGPENSCHFLDQSDAKIKPITTWSPALPCAFPRFRLFFCVFVTLSSHWLLKVFSCLPIGRCDKFGFGLTIFNRKALKLVIWYSLGLKDNVWFVYSLWIFSQMLLNYSLWCLWEYLGVACNKPKLWTRELDQFYLHQQQDKKT